MIITSKDNAIFKKLLKLQQKKYRNLEKEFLVEGHHLVQEAYQSGNLKKIVSTKKYDEYKNIEQIIVSPNLMDQLKMTVNSQEIIGVCDYLKPKSQLGNTIVFLNKLQDPGNIGTIIRMCRSFEIDSLIIQNCDVYNDKIIRASQGAIFKVNIVVTKNAEILRELKEKSYKIFATKLDLSALKLNDINFDLYYKKVVIFGNEGNGIDQEIDNLKDTSLYIPISFESLNVASAAAIVLNKIRNG